MNIFDLAAKITLDAKGFIDGIKNAGQKMASFAKSVGSAASTVSNIGGKLSSVGQGAVNAFGQAASAAVDMGEKISSVGETAVKAFAGITTAIGGAAVALTKSAVNSYADYEQLVGGVETLFKDSAGIVEEYANNAYKTAGLSANQYMETVTSFSASLLQSLGGDTKEAAVVANTAITDMADNANKMGTSMDMIQNAYQGFAKANYTMLDNLKLGRPCYCRV